MWALVRFSSLLTKTTTAFQKSLALCCLRLSVADYLSFANVSQRIAALRIRAEEKVDAGALRFLAEKQVVKFGSRGGEGFARPIRNLTDSQALCVAVWEK